MIFNEDSIKHLKIGSIYDACGDIALVKDILKSETSGTVILFVRFVRNIGDSRPYDMITLIPGKYDFRVSEWVLADSALINNAIAKRLEWIEGNELKQFEEVEVWTQNPV